MRGYILVSNEDGRRSLYVPEAHIHMYVTKGRDAWIVAAYRTDGYYGRTRAEAIATTEHLKQKYQQTTEVDVPDNIVAFAVESERRRQESVEGIEEILMQAAKIGESKSGYRAFMSQLGREKLDKEFDEKAEDKIGEEISKLISTSGGLQ